MNIPNEVIEEAHKAYFGCAPIITRQDDDAAHLRSFQVIAEWAREEALREAAEIADARTVFEAPNARLAVQYVALRIRALAEES